MIFISNDEEIKKGPDKIGDPFLMCAKKIARKISLKS